MKRRLSILILLAIALAACSQHTKQVADHEAELVSGVVSRQTADERITVAHRMIDSIAMTAPDCLKGMIFDVCKTLKECGDVKTAAAIAAYPWGVDASENPEIAARLLTSTLLPGSQAPAIMGLAPAGKQPTYTILLFHESACRTCQGLIWEIGQKYKQLGEEGVRIVTVSTDANEKVWTQYAATLPWPDKLCDYRGFYSPNMTAWGVAATPTLFLIDGKGKVVDQYGTMDEIWKVIGL